MPDKPSILLVNPHIEDFAAYDHFSKPLGLLTLAAYLKEHYHVRFINALDRLHPSNEKVKFRDDGTGDFNKRFIDKPPCLKDIPRRFKRYGLPDRAFQELLSNAETDKPEYIFVTSGMTYWYTGVRHTIRLIREVFPDTRILLGGIYASLLPGHAAQNSGADIVLPGQEINKCLDGLESILNRKFGRAYKPPAYELMGEYYYAPVLTSAGCVFNCTYCASRKLSPFIQFPADSAAETIIRLNKEFKVNHFAFYDDALLANPEEHIDVILEKVIKSGIRASFHTPNGLHIRFLTERTANLMKKAGFTDLRLSLESADVEFQNSKGPKAGNVEFEKAMGILTRAGFQRKNIRVYTLLNVPGLDTGSVEKTMHYIHRMGGLPMLAYYSPIPQTPDFENAKIITDVSEPLFQNNSVYLYRSGFNMDLLHALKQTEKKYRLSAEQE